jgi:hypothetical protein
MAGGSVTGEVNARKKMLRCPDMWARAVSEEERGEAVPFRVCTLLGFGAILRLGRIGPRGLLFLFFDFVSPFLFSEIRFVSESFAN